MATTVSGIQSKVNIFISDASTNSVSAADRLSAISQATQNLMADIGFDHFNATYSLDYFDTVHRYDVTTALPDLFEPVDLKRGEAQHTDQLIRKQPRDIATDIGNGSSQKEFSVERYDRKSFLVINMPALYQADSLHTCDEFDGNGTWVADTSTSDATNVATDSIVFQVGGGSVSFDVDVSQSGNNYASISNSTMNAVDLSGVENIATLFMWVYIPSVTNFTSVTAYWGSSSTAYWSLTATTDYNGNALVAGWNRLKFAWASATKTSTPDSSAIDYLRIDFNYAGGYADNTGFRIDQILMIRPETLTFIYETFYVGKNNSGTSLLAFTATTDVPWYSGIYDFFDNPIAHGAAAILLRQMQLETRADSEDRQYEKEIKSLLQRLPTSQLKESRAFKPRGVNFARSKV